MGARARRPDGQDPIGWTCFARDIHGLFLARTALQQSERLLKVTFGAGPMGSWRYVRGEPSVEVDTFAVGLEADDILLLCSDGLTGMISDQVMLETTLASRSLAAAAKSLIRKANDAGGRDNITVVLAKFGVAPADQTSPGSPVQQGSAGGAAGRQRKSSTLKIAGVAAAIVVIFVAAAGWRSSQAVFFLGTDSSGTVTVYRGLPYELPLGVELFEPWYASGVPATTVPADAAPKLLDHTLRSKRDAEDLVNRLELNQLNR
jgi:protein phosphatase